MISATSLPALASGLMLCDVLVGPMTVRYGQEVVHANHFLPLAKEKE